jgi:hypothetical protein
MSYRAPDISSLSEVQQPKQDRLHREALETQDGVRYCPDGERGTLTVELERSSC